MVAALKVLSEEGLAANAFAMGERLRAGLRAIQHPHIAEVRGRGLLNAIVITPSADGRADAGRLCDALKESGLLAKPTHDHIIRLAPPLVINAAQIDEAVAIIDAEVRALFACSDDMST